MGLTLNIVCQFSTTSEIGLKGHMTRNKKICRVLKVREPTGVVSGPVDDVSKHQKGVPLKG